MAMNESVLIIDDRRDNVELLIENVLRPAGYRHSVAYDGEAGLQQAMSETPDLIIMDVNIPRVSGLDVLKRLRDAQNQVPVILMTFHGSEQAAVQAFRLGAQDYIIKPYSAEQLTRSVERALSGHHLRRERDELTEAVAYAHRHSERRLKELNILSSIGKSVTALLDEDRLLTRIVEAAVYITGAEEGLLLLVDEESGDLYMRAARGLGEKYAREFRLKVSDSIAGEVVRTGKPVMITGSRKGDLLKLKTGYLVKSLLHVPLKVGEEVIGVLSVDHMFEDRKFGNHELYLLSSLADYAAMALENMRLRVKFRSLSETVSQNRPAPRSGADLEAEQSTSQFSGLLQSHRTQIDERMRAGGELVSGLREQVSSLEIWLEGVESQEQTLAQLGGRAPEALHAPHEAPSSKDKLGGQIATILDTMVEGVLMVDGDGLVVMANKTAEAILDSKLSGQHVEDICDDPRWIKTYRVVKAASQLRTGTPGSELTGATTRLAVAHRILRASFRLDLQPSRTSTGIVVILSDVTAEREAERAKESFISSVSQELRTPVTSIVGYTDLLMGESVGGLEDAQRRFLSRIRANADKISGQLNNLLGMMDVDSRELSVRAEAMDLSTAIQEAVDVMRPRFVEREQVLEIDVELALPLVTADPDAMYHVLTNLLENAHRCSPDRSQMTLRAQQMSHEGRMYASVLVTDRGGGVTSRDSKKVFNRFYRSDNPHVQGLGDPDVSLPIVKVLVETHGGRMWMDSVLGQGTTFTILLPISHGI